MGFIDEMHTCNVPLSAQVSEARTGALFQCDFCPQIWQIQSTEADPDRGGDFYKLAWMRVTGPLVISWQDAQA